MPNYLQAMAGRLGSGMGIDPRRRFAQKLMEQGVDTSPAHLGTGIGRLGKALAAAYMMRQSQDQEAAAMEWLTAKDPGRTPRPPTEEEAYAASPDLLKLHFASAAATSPTLPGGLVERLKAGGEQQEPLGLDPLSAPQPQEEDSFAIKVPTQGQREAESAAEIAKVKSDPFWDIGSETFREDQPTPSPSPTPTTGGPPDYAKQLASGMEAYQGAEANQISDPRTRMEWLRESYRNNPELQKNWFANRLIQNLMLNEIARGDEDRIWNREQEAKKTAATLAHERSQEPMPEKQFKQAKELKSVTQKHPKFYTTAEGVYKYVPDGNDIRVGSPHSQFGYPEQAGGPVTQKEKTQQLQPTKDQGGIPIHESRPWDRLPIRNQGTMQQEVHKTSRGMLEKNRQFLAKQRTMRDSLQRFKYLNSLQPTGSIADRITEFSFDEEKREMVKIQNLLTPQMRQGLPGAASDRDVAMFRGATVGIDATKEINDNIIAGALARVDNAEDRQSFMEEYFQVNQHLDGAETYWKQYLEANPIFDHRPELVGSYTLNANRKSYREFFGGGDANAGSSTLSPDKKKRLEELRRKARGQ